MSLFQSLKSQLDNKESVIGIVGLGYVGLPLMLRYNSIGYRVLGIDIDSSKVDSLSQGLSYIEHIASADISKAIESGFEATTDFSRAAECDALILCVPTPLNKYREPDISFVTKTTDALIPHLREGQVISLESTTYPGTTEEELLPRVETAGLIVGESVFLVYSPEREDPGNPNFETRTIPKVVGGHTAECLEIGQALYGHAIDQVVPVSSTQAAEMTKLLENIHRAVNIGLVNEMKIVADKMGIDIFEVVDAAATKPFGFTPYYPGPGLGGHCIPIDPFYLTWKAREYGLHTVIHLAARVHLLNDTAEDPLASFRSVNVEATVNLARKAAAAGINRFIFISSIGVYGNTSQSPFNECSGFNPHSDYALSKLEAEEQLQELSQQLGFELVIIRPVLVYGDNAPGNFGKLVSLASRLPVLPFGLCKNRRSFISVDNLAEFICLCTTHADAANEDFVIADYPAVSTRLFIDAIAAGLGKPLLQLPVPVSLMMFAAKVLGREKMAEQLLSDLEVDCSKARYLLGWSPPETMQLAMSKISLE